MLYSGQKCSYSKVEGDEICMATINIMKSVLLLSSSRLACYIILVYVD